MSRIRVVVSSVVAVVGLAIAVLAAVPALAATTGNTTANVTINNVLSLSGVTPSFTLTGDPGTTQTALAAVSYTETCNGSTGCHVQVGSNSANFVGTGANPDTFVGTTLKTRCAPLVASYTAVPLGNAPLTTSNSSTPGTFNQSCDFQIVIPSTVRPDTYSLVLAYTAIANP